MSETINVNNKNISEKIGIWFLASQLLKKHELENTGINQYHLFLWIKEYNKAYIEKEHIRKASVIKLPSSKEDILKICSTKLKMNVNKEQSLDNDFCLEFSFNDIIYHTTRTKLNDEYGNVAEDLKINDLDTELYIAPDEEYITKFSYGKSKIIGGTGNSKRKDNIKMSFESYQKKEPNDLFEEFKKGIDKFTKNGLRNEVYSMIKKFQNNRDISNEFENYNIESAAIKHKKTKQTLEKIIKGINEGIKYYKGDIEEFYKKIQEQETLILNCRNNASRIKILLSNTKDFCLWDKLHWYSKTDNVYNDWTPNYSTKEDQTSGLKIAINDVWAYSVKLSKFTLCKTKFQYHLEVIFYDHFGLDTHDVKKFGATDETFKIWYYLQHSKRFNGLYKPFVTTWSYKSDIEDIL